MRSFHLLIISIAFMLLNLKPAPVRAQENFQNIKWNAYGFARDILFMNRYTIEVQREKAFLGNNNFTSFAALYFQHSPYQNLNTGGNGFDQSWTAKGGARYYINRTPQPYDGFFVAAAPFYVWNNHQYSNLQRHNLGFELGTGYQYLINRISLEANMSVGMAGSWYAYDTPPLYKEQMGFEEQVFINAQLNIGYLFRSKSRY